MLILQFIGGLLGLGILVIIHEYGHLLAARLAGIEVEAFSIGWGKSLVTKIGKSGIQYRIGILPIGGYVRMKGETQFREALANNLQAFPYEKGGFFSAHPLKRVAVAAAGPLINLLFAVVVLSTIAAIGYEYRSFAPVILLADGDTAARRAGLADGDEIVRIGEIEIRSFQDLQRTVSASPGMTLPLRYLRNGQEFETEIQPVVDRRGVGLLGVYAAVEPILEKVGESLYEQGLRNGDRVLAVNGTPTPYSSDLAAAVGGAVGTLEFEVDRQGERKTVEVLPEFDSDLQPKLDAQIATQVFHTPRYSLFEAIGQGFADVGNFLSLTFRSLGMLFSGAGVDARDAVSGPVRISVLVGEAAVSGFSESLGTGFRQLFQFLAFISIALAFGNLLPIPVLDGGQILMYSFEAISRKKLTPRIVRIFNTAGMVLVFALLVFALFNDILFIAGI